MSAWIFGRVEEFTINNIRVLALNKLNDDSANRGISFMPSNQTYMIMVLFTNNEGEKISADIFSSLRLERFMPEAGQATCMSFPACIP